MRSPDPLRPARRLAWRVVATIGLAMLTVGLAVPPLRADADAYATAIATILCDCGCHPQSVEECACGRAAEMRRDMLVMAEGGMSGEAIVEDYVAKHGEQIRIAPTANGFNLIAWLGPFALLGVATVALLLMIRRWAAHAAVSAAQDRADDLASPPPTPDAAELDRLDRALEDWT